MGKLNAGTLTWHYETLSQGPDTLIAFHGIGQSPMDWQPLLPFLSGSFTLLAFHLPHHGPSEWETFRLGPHDFMAFNQAIAPLIQGKAIILGHSIGARLAISLFLQPKAPFHRLVLTAPDGIRDSIIYRFATRTKIGQWAMKQLTLHPRLVMGLASILKQLKIIPPGLFRLIESQYNTQEKAERIRKTWLTLSWPSFSEERMNQVIGGGKQVLACFGKYDRVIRPSIGKKLEKQCQVKVVILDKGHNLLHGDRLGILLRNELLGNSKAVKS